MSTLDVSRDYQSGEDLAWGFTVGQVAERMNVHRATVYQWMNDGRLDFVKIGANRRIPLESLLALLRGEEQPLGRRARDRADDADYPAAS
jgi:excisionase family DNA binding protein